MSADQYEDHGRRPRRPHWLVAFDRRMARSVDRVAEPLNEYVASASRPKNEYRERVRELAESQWDEQVVVVALDDVKPAFDVPGRRRDGTVKGKRLIRRFFWNVFRGVVNVAAFIICLFGAQFVVNVFLRDGSVTGPKNAQALGLVDAARRAGGPWLVYSPSQIAVLDSGTNIYTADTPLPKFLWHAAKPAAPRFSPTDRRLTWPDGSVFEYHLSDEETNVLKRGTQG